MHIEPGDIDITTLLEPILREFVAAVGVAATLRIVAQYGGTRLYIPLELTPEHDLARLIGLDKARALCRTRYAGDRHLIPKALPALCALRDARIRSNADGLSVPKLARRYGVGERRVYQIRAAEPAADLPQARLFD